jgi:hypothetical protein
MSIIEQRRNCVFYKKKTKLKRNKKREKNGEKSQGQDLRKV